MQVFARDGLFGGLVSDKYVAGPPPSTTDSEQDMDLDEVSPGNMNNTSHEWRTVVTWLVAHCCFYAGRKTCIHQLLTEL